jgi:hypothetical protein
VGDRDEPDTVAAEFAAAEAELRAKLEQAEAEYQLDLKAAERGPLELGDILYFPLGPEQAAEKRDKAMSDAEADYDRALKRIERRERVRRLAAPQLEALEAEPDDIGAGLEIDPQSDPDPIDEELYEEVMARLEDAEPLRSIEKARKLSHNKARKLEAVYRHPGRLGPNGSPGYVVRPGPKSGTVVLLKLRRKAVF